jgi:hypothetical protein
VEGYRGTGYPVGEELDLFLYHDPVLTAVDDQRVDGDSRQQVFGAPTPVMKTMCPLTR